MEGCGVFRQTLLRQGLMGFQMQRLECSIPVLEPCSIGGALHASHDVVIGVAASVGRGVSLPSKIYREANRFMACCIRQYKNVVETSERSAGYARLVVESTAQ